MKIQMVDLRSQYLRIKDDIDKAIFGCIDSTAFINGPSVSEFAKDLAAYNKAAYVVPCANGTDALQIAMMALDLKPGDEVIVPTFTYVATAEVIALLGLVPVMIDVDQETFMIDIDQLEGKITAKTKAIVPVHLFGQCADMEAVMGIAKAHNIFVIEDTAQAIGADYTFKNGDTQKAGTIGHIGTTSFFPSKNLGCYGDGGAIFTNDEALHKKMRMIANHGQERKYYHDIIGVNSRLDTLQAGILDVKLKHLDEYCAARNKAADYYDAHLGNIAGLTVPARVKNSTHVFHQYTLLVADGKRDELQKYLQSREIPTMIYYPLPLHMQKAYYSPQAGEGSFPVAEALCKQVLSLPIHTEMTTEQLAYIVASVQSFFN
jgi:UDP-2-acetamido-2-deoxy-ribo-hexuluronate aminotransferase